MTQLEVPPQEELARSVEKPAGEASAMQWLPAALAGGLVGYGLTHPLKLRGWAAAAAGYALLQRGSEGTVRMPRGEEIRDAVRKGLPALGLGSRRGVRVERSHTVMRGREDILDFWGDVERWPEFMRHVDSVTPVGDRRFHLRAAGGSGRVFEWAIEVPVEHDRERVTWSSVPGGDVETDGSVRLQETIGGRGTIVAAVLDYRPGRELPAAAVADFFHPGLKGMIEEDLRRGKQLLETGEIPTTEGQPSGRRSVMGEAVPV